MNICNKQPAVGVAVSGGGDSMALLHLAHMWGQVHDIPIHAVTIDHGLRAAAADEAATVARFCEDRDILHDTLRWTDWDKRGNLQNAARQARKRLINEWRIRRGIGIVLLGHTADDQAETVLMRLARGSGVDGLAGIRARTGIWFRPLMDLRRQALRDYLGDHNITWMDDPTNEDDRYDRVKARKMLAQLSELGLTTKRLTTLAEHMQGETVVLHERLEAFSQQIVTQVGGELLIKPAPFRAAPMNMRTRLLAKAFQWVAAAPYQPRFKGLVRMAQAGSGTLHGCQMQQRAGYFRISREYNAVAKLVGRPDDVWDRRWRMIGPTMPNIYIAALGKRGVAACPDWRSGGMDFASVKATPAVWQGDLLIAAPFAGYSNGWTAQIVTDFQSSLVTH